MATSKVGGEATVGVAHASALDHIAVYPHDAGTNDAAGTGSKPESMLMVENTPVVSRPVAAAPARNSFPQPPRYAIAWRSWLIGVVAHAASLYWSWYHEPVVAVGRM